ncbi:MAG TPA: cytochrome c biogenesis protein CcdA [Deinococcales bacterium]|nr:cytochrome c biogenesis protein CcdA [Deinococcales bacterium]
MASALFFGGSVLAATIAGMIALFAPCCISVMLPAYFSSTFQNRGLLVLMTFIFAAGVATIILPLALGANALRTLLSAQHLVIYVIAGGFMLLMAGFLLLGGQLHLPMPGRPAGGAGGPWSVYTLGVFSGIASSCCAPVLAGVIALSSVASSFWAALTLGLAYTFGMVAPLFLISVLWDARDWRKSPLFRPRTFRYRLGARQVALPATNLASGALLGVMGLASVYTGVFSEAMPTPKGWQLTLALKLQNIGHATTDALAWIPAWAGVAILAALIVALSLKAVAQVRDTRAAALEPSAQPAPTEGSHEH